MVWNIFSATLALVPVTATRGGTPGGLVFVSIVYFGTGITGMVLGKFVPMGPTVAYLGETAVWACV